MSTRARDRATHNHALDDFFETHPEDRGAWWATKAPQQLPVLYELLAEDERFGVTDLVHTPEPHRVYLAWQLAGFPQKGIAASARTFTLCINPDLEWPKVRRMEDGKEVWEEAPRVVEFERQMKSGERRILSIKPGQQVPMPAEFAILAMDLYGPKATITSNRNKLVEVRPASDDRQPIGKPDKQADQQPVGKQPPKGK